jgi:DNA-binding protein YbaB
MYSISCLCRLLLLVYLASVARSWTNEAARQQRRGAVNYVPLVSLSRKQHPSYRRNTNDYSRPRADLSKTFAFPWFGGSDDDNRDESDEIPSASLSGVANIMDSMASFKTSQRVEDRTSAVLQDLSNVLVEGASRNGKVKVTYNGQQQPMAVQIDEGYFQSLDGKDGAEKLGKALTEAMQEGHTKSAGKMEEKLKSLYSDLGFETA